MVFIMKTHDDRKFAGRILDASRVRISRISFDNFYYGNFADASIRDPPPAIVGKIVDQHLR